MTSKTNAIIKLWLLAMPKSNQLSTKLIKNLAEAQQQHYKNLSLKRQNVYCLTRTLLNHALTDAFDNKNIHWEITEQLDLPPKITLATDCSNTVVAPKFSISHTKNTIGIAIGEANCSEISQLGLDIEVVNSKRSLESAGFFCNKNQLNEIDLLKDTLKQRQHIIRLWTQKEAYFKAHSQTILNPNLKALSVSTNLTADKYLSSTSMSDSTEISIYSDAEILIKPQWIAFDASGNIKKLLPIELNWQNYGVLFT